MGYSKTFAWSGTISQGENFIDIMKDELGIDNIKVKKFTLQCMENTIVELSDESTLGTYYQSDSNYILDTSDPNSVTAMIYKIEFLNNCTIIRINVAYS